MARSEGEVSLASFRNKENLLKMEIERPLYVCPHSSHSLGNKENLLKMEIERPLYVCPHSSHSLGNKENLLKMEIERHKLPNHDNGWEEKETKKIS